VAVAAARNVVILHLGRSLLKSNFEKTDFHCNNNFLLLLGLLLFHLLFEKLIVVAGFRCWDDNLLALLHPFFFFFYFTAFSKTKVNNSNVGFDQLHNNLFHCPLHVHL
jgi:hypothetical protein